MDFGPDVSEGCVLVVQQNPMMQAMMDPTKREAMQAKFEELKKDPEVAPILEELESGNPQAMMKWVEPVRAQGVVHMCVCSMLLQVIVG